MLAGEGKGERAYVIPLGGSDVLGLWGYLSMFDELRAQVPHGAVSDIVVACGSGGTACGLAIANYLTGGAYKIHAGVRVIRCWLCVYGGRGSQSIQ
jgi:1-aminocyclopropane-1-carboxylate deaminase/D-cysteine desulfhydrase-like pyridoxal-dependent ACC family enzyme